MGRPKFGWEDIPLAYAMDTADMPLGWGALERPVAVSMGNPHAVFFVPDCDAVPLDRLGPEIEHDTVFPERVNVNVATVASRERIRLRVWERGAGLTLACGSGACATFAAARRRGLVDSRAMVALPGGDLEIAETARHACDDRAGRHGVPGRDRPVSAARAVAEVVTHGCRSNLAERDALAALAPAGATVINSCAVTAEAVRDGRAAVRSALRNGPVVVTGCAATLMPERFAGLGADIMPNALKLDPTAWNRGPSGAPAAVTRQSRGFVAIQDGCDHDCTFCVTRLARGRSRSVPVADVVARARALVDAGVNEVVLTGIDTTSYGADLAGSPLLGALVQAVLRDVPGLRRLRLSSLDAAEADPALVEAFGDVRLMPHVHLSLQSGDDLILKRMKRRHSRADAVRLVERLKAVRPDIAVGADLIAGFPTEGEVGHANSLSLLQDCDIVHAHVFPYSARPGTAAARMPQVRPEIAKARAAALRAAGDDRKHAFLYNMLESHVETVSEGMQGLTSHGARLRYRAPQARGSIVSTAVAAVENGVLVE
jgi:threonylcarbamoyladenosine tRNA methylthiotransferase MtaB